MLFKYELFLFISYISNFRLIFDFKSKYSTSRKVT